MENEFEKDMKQLKTGIDVLDKIIAHSGTILKIAESEIWDKVISDFNEERLSAIEDYLSAKTEQERLEKQAYAKLWNFVVNLFHTYKNPTELRNLLAQKDNLADQLAKYREYQYSGDKQTGGAV